MLLDTGNDLCRCPQDQPNRCGTQTCVCREAYVQCPNEWADIDYIWLQQQTVARSVAAPVDVVSMGSTGEKVTARADINKVPHMSTLFCSDDRLYRFSSLVNVLIIYVSF